MARERLDKLLVQRQLADDVEIAKRLIMAGKVVVNNHRIDKAGTQVDINADIRLKKQIPYVSRGGLKLEKAIKIFNIDFKDKIVMDIGASTGGFTDVSLKFGAKKVYCVDVGKSLLHNKLQNNNQIINLEKTNFRNIDKNKIFDEIDIFVTDVSFISLTKIIPNIQNLSSINSIFIPLIKPQFEANKNQVEEKGLITDYEIHIEVVMKIIKFASEHNFKLKGLTVSPIKGAKGNIEYLAYFIYCDKKEIDFDDAYLTEMIKKVVYENDSFNS
jgi:23S rRNA (cytidine1920-2'-O)/16S rRNA (cytidine1409-2'-O)-methyltransferase